jgi:hypothetical protein
MNKLKQLVSKSALCVATAIVATTALVNIAEAAVSCPSGQYVCKGGCCPTEKNCCGSVWCVSVEYPKVKFQLQAPGCQSNDCKSVSDCPK